MLPLTFHPVIRNWFTETFGKPTSVQAEAWPLIEKGENVLALAPTGSGKTLTAFLSAISRFCVEGQQKYNAEKLSVLYVSPLKALNEDIKRNLLIPLAAIKSRFEKEGLEFPPIRVETRSGDTPQSQRRRFYIRPPSILALTPESLAIILLNPKGRLVLSGIKYLIIDEVHALIGNKRGAYLSCQIDRLSLIAGEFQRISLSATVRNPQVTSDFIGGINRKVNIVAPPAEKIIDFSIEFPDMQDGDFETRYTPLIDYVLRRIWEGSTLLVFAESRRRAERLCYFINTEAAVFFARHGNPVKHDLNNAQTGYAVAFPHHGSLSKELRRSVEKGLAEGRLPCVVATASLELGIDIGDINEVVLAGSPGNVSQVLQRIGRSGHNVGQVSKGKLFAFHGKDLLLAAAIKDAVDERDIEEIKPIECPQDILAQLILALCSEKDRNIDELYELIKKFYIFKNLNYDSFIRVVRMLAGFGEKSRLRDIKPRLWLDKIEETIGVLDGTTTLLYTSSGVITNRGLYSLRLEDGTKIGELDEEFVWERAIGDCFDFGARGWRIKSINAESVEVIPLDKRAEYIPFWKGEAVFRSINLTKRLLSILEEYNKTKSINTNISKEARNSLMGFIDLQYNAQKGQPLPDKKNIVIEIIKGTELNRDFCSVVFHSFRGGQINYPLSLAISMELEEIVKLRVASFSNDDNILFLIPRLGLEEAGADSMSIISTEEIFRKALSTLEKIDGGICRGERLFRNRLESSGLFGASFREAAERCLLLPKAPFGKRTPLWIMRQRSKRLFDSVASSVLHPGEDSFPVTAEAWRTCLVDIFDMDGFRELLTDINNKNITLSFFTAITPSPFSRDIVRQETNAFMYEYDERNDLAGSRSATLSDKVIEEAIGNAALRPALKQEIIDGFVSRLRREITGYAPEDTLSLNEWVKERIAIPADEWETLKAVLPQSLTENIDTTKIKTITRNGAEFSSIVHREWEETWIKEPLNLLGQWLRYQGPISIERICTIFGVTPAETQDAINALTEVDEVVQDITITPPSQNPHSSLNTSNSTLHTKLICDRENLEMLLRLSRKKERPVIKERHASIIVPFLALRQGLTADNTTFNKNLYTWTAPVKLWETELLCARNQSYDPEKIN
ncbi:MAG: DEAD/DEAH box helicase, partial [Treponema sp.]|nr:DEAD/DEAH box helicase [Treponema sp.]